MKTEQLIAIIEVAFDGVPQPTSMTLHDAEAWDSYDSCTDEERKRDNIDCWQNLPFDHVEKCQYALPHLDKIGLRFYLPAYMTYYLKTLDAKGWWFDSTLYSLDNHPNNSPLSEYHKERFSLFSESQMRACALFVKFCMTDATHSDTCFAQEIFDGYWHRYA